MPLRPKPTTAGDVPSGMSATASTAFAQALSRARIEADLCGEAAGDRDADDRQSVRGHGAQSRPQRKRVTFHTRIAAAKTPGQRVSAAAQFVASALAEVSPTRADQVATHTVDQLINLAEQLLKEASAA